MPIRKYNLGDKRMIKAEKAKETRARDVKRNRVVLTVGERSWHLSQEEAKKLAADLSKLTSR